MDEAPDGMLRYSVSLVTQGNHRFYTLTMPSDVLSRTCFVTTREEDPQAGFQRVLDQNRATQIASYIDSGFGTIPSSIVLSAQPDADLEIVGRGKTLQFRDSKKAFLVLDGQHRVYGFSFAKTALRVPVVIYNGLTRQDESRLFIDINTKQRPVPNELLLDIKKLADYENDTEQLLGELFDRFADSPDSPLLGFMSPSARTSGRLSRVTFNAAIKPLISVFKDNDTEVVYNALRAYLAAFVVGASTSEMSPNITNSTVFRGVMLLFPDVAQRVKDRFGAIYEERKFFDVLEPMFSRLKANTFKNPGGSLKELHAVLAKALKEDFTL
ncbi:MAG TPA: DGQHR domain-containing protein [Longimicrobiaceae bacterium]|jgi:DGQHR domain-containing protein|nr:DGQHR domain-containing protein [Longimicrobiaceae bacterium]